MIIIVKKSEGKIDKNSGMSLAEFPCGNIFMNDLEVAGERLKLPNRAN